MTAPKRPCRCDSRYDGCGHPPNRCGEAPGTRWGPYFCPDCDKRRRAHISANLAAIVAAFPPGGGAA